MTYDNPIIKKRFEEKMRRWDKKDLSIEFCWAVNCANAFLREEEKGTEKGFKKIEKWYPRFIDLHRNYMIDNMPEPTSYSAPPPNTKPPTKKESEELDRKVEELRQEGIAEEEKRRLEEAESEYLSSPLKE